MDFLKLLSARKIRAPVLCGSAYVAVVIFLIIGALLLGVAETHNARVVDGGALILAQPVPEDIL